MPLQGVVKVYDPTSGTGIVLSEADQSEIYLRSGSLSGSIFRNLRQGQRIVFEVEHEGGKVYAHSVRIGHDGY